MKSLAELAAIREKMKDKVVLREGSGEIRVVVGMATCGIAAGARPVLNAFVEEVSKAGPQNAGVLDCNEDLVEAEQFCLLVDLALEVRDEDEGEHG